MTGIFINSSMKHNIILRQKKLQTNNFLKKKKINFYKCGVFQEIMAQGEIAQF